MLQIVQCAEGKGEFFLISLNFFVLLQLRKKALGEGTAESMKLVSTLLQGFVLHITLRTKDNEKE